MLLEEEKPDLGFKDYIEYNLHFYYTDLTFEDFRKLIFTNTMTRSPDKHFTVLELCEKHKVSIEHLKKLLIALNYVTLEEKTEGIEYYLPTDCVFDYTILPTFPIKFEEILWDKHIIEVILESKNYDKK